VERVGVDSKKEVLSDRKWGRIFILEQKYKNNFKSQ
jgi:hypothetical protein